MKHTYAVPMLVISGSVVGTTLGGQTSASVESIPLNTKPSSAGSVGFNL